MSKTNKYKPSLRVVRLGRVSPACRRQASLRPTSIRAVRGGARKDASEHDQSNEAEETGQVRVNLHESLDQQGSRAKVRARPPVLNAVRASPTHRTCAGPGFNESWSAEGLSCWATVKTSRATGATGASANKSKKVLLVLCSSSSDELSSQQAHMARQMRA